MKLPATAAAALLTALASPHAAQAEGGEWGATPSYSMDVGDVSGGYVETDPYGVPVEGYPSVAPYYGDALVPYGREAPPGPPTAAPPAAAYPQMDAYRREAPASYPPADQSYGGYPPSVEPYSPPIHGYTRQAPAGPHAEGTPPPPLPTPYDPSAQEGAAQYGGSVTFSGGYGGGYGYGVQPDFGDQPRNTWGDIAAGRNRNAEPPAADPAEGGNPWAFPRHRRSTAERDGERWREQPPRPWAREGEPGANPPPVDYRYPVQGYPVPGYPPAGSYPGYGGVTPWNAYGGGLPGFNWPTLPRW